MYFVLWCRHIFSAVLRHITGGRVVLGCTPVVPGLEPPTDLHVFRAWRQMCCAEQGLLLFSSAPALWLALRCDWQAHDQDTSTHSATRGVASCTHGNLSCLGTCRRPRDETGSKVGEKWVKFESRADTHSLSLIVTVSAGPDPQISLGTFTDPSPCRQRTRSTLETEAMFPTCSGPWLTILSPSLLSMTQVRLTPHPVSGETAWDMCPNLFLCTSLWVCLHLWTHTFTEVHQVNS